MSRGPVDEGSHQKNLIERPATQTMTVTTVTIEMTSSSVWWSVQLRFEPLGQPPFSERLLVHTAAALPTGRSISWSHPALRQRADLPRCAPCLTMQRWARLPGRPAMRR